MKISYFLSTDGCQTRFLDKINELLKNENIRRICDVGGGANPLLPLQTIEKFGLEYTVLDISAAELDKAPSSYNKILADISSPTFSVEGEFDLVCTQFLAEHVSSGFHFHKNVWKLLSNNGYAFHYFPTLYNFPYIANLVFPEELAEKILLSFSPDRIKSGRIGKFPAYYDWCYGPTRQNIRNFENLKYSVEEYTGFFGHGYYAEKKALQILDIMEKKKSKLLLKYPNPWLTQFAHVLLRKQ
jgi:hypothetical protein